MKIFHRFDGSKVLFKNACGTLRETVLVAVSEFADLRFADLRFADLRSANLESADLRSANLRSANLRSADLRSADLRSADLRSADLRSADLRSADLRSADLESANLRSANLESADLRSANLRSANLRSADLRSADLESANLRSAKVSYEQLLSANTASIKADIWDVLLRAPREIEGLLLALREGRVDGSVYEGECACLVGTIANVAHTAYAGMEFLKPNAARPAERWFLAIRKGDSPENSGVVKLTVEWIEEFSMLLNRAVAMREVRQ